MDGIAYVRYTCLHTCNAAGTAPLVCVSSPRAQDRDTQSSSQQGNRELQERFFKLPRLFFGLGNNSPIVVTHGLDI